jgi:hypothetical protein
MTARGVQGQRGNARAERVGEGRRRLPSSWLARRATLPGWLLCPCVRRLDRAGGGQEGELEATAPGAGAWGAGLKAGPVASRVGFGFVRGPGRAGASDCARRLEWLVRMESSMGRTWLIVSGHAVARVAGRVLGLWCSCSPYLSRGQRTDVALTWQLLYAPLQLFSCASWGAWRTVFGSYGSPALSRSFGGVYLLLNSGACAGLVFVCAVMGVSKVSGAGALIGS